MARNTDALIDRLTTGVTPVRRLPPPVVRAAVWSAIALSYVALVVVVLSARSDLTAKAHDAGFVVEVLAALATGLAAAIAAFATVVPGSSRKTLVGLLVPLAVWLARMGQSCVQEWLARGPGGLALGADWSCFPAIATAGAVPVVAMAMMLRRGAPLTPALSMALGGLAAGGVADFGLRLHHHEAGLTVLVWHVGAVAAICTMAAWSGPRLLHWRGLEDA